MAADDDASARLTALVGVRRARNGPLIFATAPGLTLRPGDIVLVQAQGEPRGPSEPSTDVPRTDVFVAAVVIGSGQIIADAVGIEPVARVLRLASDAEIQNWNPTGLRLEAPGRVREAGLPDAWDGWLQDAGAEPRVSVEHMEAGGPTAGDFIRRLFPDPPPPRPPKRRDR